MSADPPPLPFSYPRTREEWWQLFDHHRDALRRMTEGYHPCSLEARMQPPAPISAPAAEALCEEFRGEIAAAGKENPLTTFDLAAHERDGPAMARLLNDVWIGLPESMDTRAMAGFHALCDLCSEADCVYPGEKEEET